MPIPRVRFTVRRLMVAVIAVAALLGAFASGIRWERSRQDAFDQTWLVRVAEERARLDRQIEEAAGQLEPYVFPDLPEPE